MMPLPVHWADDWPNLQAPTTKDGDRHANALVVGGPTDATPEISRSTHDTSHR
jgi:hypothetical protein